jgi:hypothetical protein
MVVVVEVEVEWNAEMVLPSRRSGAAEVTYCFALQTNTWIIRALSQQFHAKSNRDGRGNRYRAVFLSLRKAFRRRWVKCEEERKRASWLRGGFLGCSMRSIARRGT